MSFPGKGKIPKISRILGMVGKIWEFRECPEILEFPNPSFFPQKNPRNFQREKKKKKFVPGKRFIEGKKIKLKIPWNFVEFWDFFPWIFFLGGILWNSGIFPWIFWGKFSVFCGNSCFFGGNSKFSWGNSQFLG